MESIALVRKDGSHREQVSAKNTAEARRMLDQWDQEPIGEGKTAGRKGGLRVTKSPARKKS